MQIGVCVTTKDRSSYLDTTLRTLQANKYSCVRVVVDNSDSNLEKKHNSVIACRNKFDWIDGKRSSGPVGQNLGFRYLLDKVPDLTAVFKCDDDLRFSPTHFPNLLKVFKEHYSQVGCVGGTFWSRGTSQIVARHPNKKFKIVGGNFVSDECPFRYRVKGDVVVKVRHLTCSYLYSVSAAKRLVEMTESVRGPGPFAEYLSRIAFREETEFPYLLWHLLALPSYFVSAAMAFHFYAPLGGTRKISEAEGCRDAIHRSDEELVKGVCKKLGVKWNLKPAWVD